MTQDIDLVVDPLRLATHLGEFLDAVEATGFRGDVLPESDTIKP